MKKILLFIFIISLPSFILGNDVKNNKTISDLLIEEVISGKGYNPYTSALLLAQLRISDKNEKYLINQYNKENNLSKKLFIANIFVSRLIGEYEKEFIHLFPQISDKDNIINITYGTEYVHIISPLYETLIALSYDDEEALTKLLTTLKYVQGGYAESLYGAVDLIYKSNPKYVESVAKKNKLDLKKLLISK